MRHAKIKKFKKFSAQHFKVGLVVTQFNANISAKLLASAKNMLALYKVPSKNITIVTVAGCVEIPVVLQALASAKTYSCLVALGSVIRGATTHYDYVCKIISEGVLRVMLDHTIPVGFGILTVENNQQALERSSLGGAAVAAALESARKIQKIS